MAVPSLADKRARVLSALTLGVETSYLDIERQQMAIGMKACIAGASTADIPWAAAFPDDALRDQSVDGLIVRVDLHPHETEIERRIGSYREIASRWEELRRKVVQTGQRQSDRLGRQIALELGREADAVFHYAELYVNAVRSGEVLSPDVLLTDHVLCNLSGKAMRPSGAGRRGCGRGIATAHVGCPLTRPVERGISEARLRTSS